MTDLVDMSATALLAGFAARSVSPSEVWKAVEDRITAFEPRIAALYAYDPERARQDAAASTARWSKGEPRGRLDGLPVTVKELIGTRGVPVPRGSAATALIPAGEDAPPAARLREDAAIIFAKTTCPDYGMLTSGLSSFHLLSRNPWDVRLNPGGSSAGASAAAAAGYGPLHVGTDIGGSIRLPAALTGTVGFKPSNGRVPIDPYWLGRCAGPMTRTVADAALMMGTLSRSDPRDDTALPSATIAWHSLDRDVEGLRIGLMLDGGCGLAPEPEVRAAVVEAARAFEAAGAIVEEVGPVLTRAMLDGLDRFWRARSWAEIGAMVPEDRAKVLPYIREWAETGARVSGVEAVRGYDETNAMRRSLRAALHPGRRGPVADDPRRVLPGRMGLAAERSGKTVRAYRVHGAVEHVRAAGAVAELRLLEVGPADRAADRRSTLRGPVRPAARRLLRSPARADKLAGAVAQPLCKLANAERLGPHMLKVPRSARGRNHERLGKGRTIFS